MGRRGTRSLKELLDVTERLEGPEITPVLQGSCRIQGPMDELDHNLQRKNSGIFPAEKRLKSVNEHPHSRAESGTCNVCSAPCSSCLHINQAVSIMESNLEAGISDNMLRRKEADSSSFIGFDEPPNYKNKCCHDQRATSETSIQISVSSSHDSYSENAESKATLRASSTCDTSEDVNIPPKISFGDAVGGAIELKNVSSHSQPTSFEHHKQLSGLDLEKHKSEYHEDNASCITGVRDANSAVHDLTVNFDKKDIALSSVSMKIAQDTEELVQAVLTHSNHDHETEECQGKPLSSNLGPHESLQKYDSGHNDLEGDSSSQHQIQAFESSKKSVKSLLGQLDADNCDERKGTGVSDCENKQTDNVKRSSGYSKNVNSCLEAENGMDIDTPYNEILKCSTMNESSEEPVSLIEPSNIHGPETQSQSSPKNENPELDVEDVEVCDICGDAGREECLAICSRCHEGAEHTYCMRIMLDKIPEGDWLCEECKLKEEREKQKVDRCESLTRNSKNSSFNENSQYVGSTLSSKLLPKLEIKANVPEEKGLNKGLRSPQIYSKKHADNLGTKLVASEKASESIGGFEAASLRKKSVLSRESSFKNLDVGKGKLANIPQSSGDQNANTSQASARSQTPSGSDILKNLSQPQTSRRLLSKSTSFKTNSKGKVIQLTENVRHKEKDCRESAFVDRRKDGSIRTMSKSASFRCPNSGRSDTETVSKGSPLNSPRTEDLERVHRVKERNRLERKNSFVIDRSLSSPSPSAGAGFPSSKPEQKTAWHEGKSNSISESSFLGTNKGSDDASSLGCSEEKRQSLSLPKSLDGPSTNGIGNSEGQKSSLLPQRGTSQAGQPTYRDKMSREPSFSSSLRQAVPGGSRVLRCQKCNETGHTTQFCSIDKLRVSALKPSAERISREGNIKSSNVKEAAESTISKNRMQKGSRLLNEAEEIAIPSANLCSEVASKNTPSTSSSLRSSSSMVGRIEGQGILRYPGANYSKIAAHIDVKQQGREGDAVLASSHTLNVNPTAEVLPTQTSVLGNPLRASASQSSSPSVVGKTVGRGILRYPAIDHSKTAAVIDVKKQLIEGEASLASSNELNVKQFTEMLPTHVSVLGNPLRASAVPECDSIWQGAFEIMRTERTFDLFDGVQAHLSNCSSPKVVDIVTKFPCNIKLEEVDRRSSWPSQFQISGPKEDNIALFFFAKDVKSYEKSYSKLLDSMLKNDLALRGSIDGVELLIFPSTMLPDNSQRWNRLFFLWGVFRERRIVSIENLPGFQKKSCSSSLDIDSSVQDVPFRDVAEVSEENSSDNQRARSSGFQNKIYKMQEPPCFQTSLFDSVTADKLPSEPLSCPSSVGCSLDSIRQPLGVLHKYSESGLQVDPMQMSTELRNCSSHMKNLGSDPESGKGMDSHHDNLKIISSNNTGLPTSAVSLFDNPGMGTESTRDVKTGEKEIRLKAEADLVEHNHLSWESRPNRKRSHSCSLDSQVSGETSKSTNEVFLWGEKANCISSVDQKDHKKMKPSSSSSSREETSGSRLSSKVHPIFGSLLNGDKQRDGVYDENMLSETSISAERSFFPVDKGTIRDTRSDNVIHVLSSDDEDSPESNTPNLELALAGRKKSSKKEALPLFRPLVDINNKPDELCADDGNDVSASLSLSLAFPGTDEERKSNLRPQAEPLLPERPCLNTSLFLFGGFSDT